jgi:protein O-GlcNAc transferase
MNSRLPPVEESAALLQRGDARGARIVLERAAANSNCGIEILRWLCVACTRTGDLAAARSAVDRALRLAPLDANLLLMASNTAQDQRDLSAGLEYANRLVAAAPSYAQGYNNLGILLSDSGEAPASERAFRRAIELKPDYARAYANLAATLLKLDKVDEAIVAASRASALQPDYAHAHHMLGASLFRANRLAEAEKSLRLAIQYQPRSVESWLTLARALKDQYRAHEAEQALRQVLQLSPQLDDARALLAEVLWVRLEHLAARQTWELLLGEKPEFFAAALKYATAIPPIYRDAGQVDRARTAYADNLAKLAEWPYVDTSRPQDLIREIQGVNFYLAYQGRDDRALQRQYADFVGKVLQRAMPAFFRPKELRLPVAAGSGTRIRIGFVSRFFYECTAGKYFVSWVTDLPRDDFEVVAIYTHSRVDQLTEQVRARADKFVHTEAGLEELAKIVEDASLDVLIYPELGMDGKIFALSSLRLAPIQACGWGHPVTPGHRNIDHYLSCALMEPANAAEHYSETLELLPGLGVRYDPPSMPEEIERKSRRDFQLPEGRVLYLLPQSLFKVHPDNDELIVDLLKADANAVLVMFATVFPEWTNAFVARLSAAFARAGISPAGRVKILPNLSHPEFVRVNQLCDVMIDTLYWSGGNTSLDALATGLPIVTLPGEFMRGRQSAAMLNIIGMAELIAEDKAHYLRIALKLGREAEYRNYVKQTIVQNRERLFNDREPVRALESIIKRWVKERRSAS